MALSAQGEVLRFPLRLMGEQRVDLLPLFNYWTNMAAWQKEKEDANTSERQRRLRQEPARPLKAWVRVMGTNDGVTGAGWIISGEVQERPGKGKRERFVIRHVPEADRNKFAGLQGALQAQERAAERAKQVASSSGSEASGLFARGDELNGLGNDVPALRGQTQERAREYWNAAQRQYAISDEARASAAAHAAERERIAGEMKRWKRGAGYTVDFFALRTGERINGLPVYDVGLLIGAE